MMLSLIVTTYNRPDALSKVLEALSRQSVAPGEVLIADDGSGHRTRQTVERFRQRVPFGLEHVWHEDRGFRAARIRNAAIRRSGGDYIVLLDGDCIPGPHFVEDHRRLAETGCFFQGKRVFVSRRKTDDFTAALAGNPSALWRCVLSGDLKNSHHLLRLTPWPAMRSRRLRGIKSCNMGIFRNDLFAVNGFNEDFVGWGREDSELAVRLFRYGLRRKGHPFMAVCYHLWHLENDRGRLDRNDDILARTQNSRGYVCQNGLSKG
jgi:glycosyltransferase involved in cell wall biosynthesis